MTLYQVRTKLKQKGIHIQVTDIKYQRGYKSRRNYVMDNEELMFVPMTSNNRRGQAFILAPCYNTTRYCERVYFNVTIEMLEQLGIL